MDPLTILLWCLVGIVGLWLLVAVVQLLLAIILAPFIAAQARKRRRRVNARGLRPCLV